MTNEEFRRVLICLNLALVDIIEGTTSKKNTLNSLTLVFGKNLKITQEQVEEVKNMTFQQIWDKFK